jgi:IS5 family transposase
MSTPKDECKKDLFRPALDSIIDLKHPMVLLAQRIDWTFLEPRLGGVYRPGQVQPPLPMRPMAGLKILKYMQSLSDEVLCARFLDSPNVQFFCDEAVFRHDLPFDRSSLTRRRQRLGEEHLTALLQESLSWFRTDGKLHVHAGDFSPAEYRCVSAHIPDRSAVPYGSEEASNDGGRFSREWTSRRRSVGSVAPPRR